MLDLEKIGLDLRKGVRIRNYRRLFRLHQNCFLGSDAVKFLVEKKLAVDERDAVLLGRKLLRNGLFRHVTNERDFKNEKELYRFTQDDEDVQPVGMVFAADLDDEEALEVVEVLRNNLVIKNRRRKLLLFKNCFVGSDACNVMVKRRLVQTKTEALSIGQALLEGGYFCHVCNDHPFEDSSQLYRFADDWNLEDDLEMEVMVERAQVELGHRLNRDSDETVHEVSGEHLLLWMIERGFVLDEDEAFEVACYWLELGVLRSRSKARSIEKICMYSIDPEVIENIRYRSGGDRPRMPSFIRQGRPSILYKHGRDVLSGCNSQSRLRRCSIGDCSDVFNEKNLERRAFDALQRPMDNVSTLYSTVPPSKVTTEDSHSGGESPKATKFTPLKMSHESITVEISSDCGSKFSFEIPQKTSKGGKEVDSQGGIKHLRYRGVNPVPGMYFGNESMVSRKDSPDQQPKSSGGFWRSRAELNPTLYLSKSFSHSRTRKI